MKPLLILLSLLFVALEANAQNWVRTAGPVEDDVFDLCIDSNGVSYATTAFGVNRSTDGGSDWTRPFLFPQPFNGSRIVVAQNGNIVASTSLALFVSTDGGSTFTVTRQDSISNHVVQFAVTGSGRIFAVLKSTFLVSDDHGVTWTNAPRAGMGSERVYTIAASDDTVICMNQDRLCVSVDNGNTWQLRNRSFSSSLYPSLVIHPNGTWLCSVNSQGVYHYVTEQDEWTLLPGETFPSIHGLDIMPNGDVLVSVRDGIMRLENLSSWSNISAGLPWDTVVGYIPIYRFAYSPKSKLYYAATRGTGVWKSAPTLLQVNTARSLPSCSVHPNPARARLTIDYTAITPGTVTCKLHDMLGRVHLTQRDVAMAGQNSFSFDARSLLPGTYLIVLEVSGEVKTQRVTIVQ